MNKKNYSLFVCLMLTAATLYQSTHARFYVGFDEDPLDMMDGAFTKLNEEIRNFQKEALRRIKMMDDGLSYGLSKEEIKELKDTQEKLDNLALSVDQDKKTGVVTVTLTGFEGLEKKHVEIDREDDHWVGAIQLKNGRCTFFLDAYGIEMTRTVEMKREVKKEEKAAKKASEAKETPVRQERSFYRASSVSEGRAFSPAVDIATLKAHSIKPTELVLTVTAKIHPKQRLEIPEIDTKDTKAA